MSNRRFHSTGKGNSAPLPAGQGHAASGFRGNHPRRRLRYFPEKPCTAGARTFWSLWNEIPGSASLTITKGLWT
ncbi:MAG: hypothetical protein ACLVGH_06760 [Bacteroides xylanisolvens]